MLVPTLDCAPTQPGAGNAYTGRRGSLRLYQRTGTSTAGAQDSAHTRGGAELSPFDGASDYNVRNLPNAAEIMGFGYSFVNISGGAVPINPADANTSVLYSANSYTDTGAHATGILLPAVTPSRTGETTAINDGKRGQTAGATTIVALPNLVTPATGGVTVDHPTGYYIVSMNGFLNVTDNLSHDPFTPTIHHGPVIGGYCGIPLGAADLATNQNGQTVRKVTVPFDCRVQEITFYYAASAAGNSARVNNVTQSLDLCSMQSLVTTSPDTANVTAVNLNNQIVDAFKNLGSRDLKRGDVLQIIGTTGNVAGFTDLCAVVWVWVKGHPYDQYHRDFTYQQNNDYPSGIAGAGAPGANVRVKYSGPLIGGNICVPFGYGSVAANQTNQVISQFIAPCDMSIYFACHQAAGAAAATSGRIFNVTQNNVPVVGLPAFAANAAGVGDFTNGVIDKTVGPSSWGVKPQINKGDVLQYQVTTGANAATRCGAYVYAVTQGYIAVVANNVYSSALD